MLHAVRNPFRIVDLDDETTLYIGADQAGQLLEVAIAGIDSDHPRIIHAMRLRRKFYDFP